MEKGKKNKLNIRNIILVILILAIFVYVIYITYNLIKKPTDTFLVQNGNLSSEISTQGYIIRDEIVLKGENYKNGIVQIKSEGERVAKGDAIFRYYTKGEENLLKKIQDLDVKIQEAWDSENNSIFSSDIKLLEQQIESKLNDAYESNDLQKVKEYKNDLNSYITKKAKIAGSLSPSGSYLKKLIDERSEYENQLNSGSEYLKATSSGIVSYRVDGLEEVLTSSNFGSLSKKMLEDLNLKTGQIVSTSDESGKIINNFYCYIACILKENVMEDVEVGNKITIRLSNSKEVTAEVAYISREDRDEYLLVFKIDRYVEELISYRKISFDIIWWNASGWKVPNEAIKYESEDLAYVVRKRVGYTDKIYIKVLKTNDKYSIIENYETTKELVEKGVSQDLLKNRKKISLYDELEI